MIAALFVESDGVYSGWPWIDLWDIERDARFYDGHYPVVAHPPCQLWGAMAAVNYARWGGDHNKPGNDGNCFLYAKHHVQARKGVLEHPAKSRAFYEYGIGRPEFGTWKESDNRMGWITEVWQSAYGHKANKATWLYFVGNKKPFDLKWEKIRGSHQIGFQDKRGKDRNKPTLSKKEANATPLLFRDELLKLAIMAGGL
jgi:hypothetical protein